MRMTHLFRFVFALLFGALWFACVAMGQTETATVSGLITDETGAVVPGAGVELQSVERGTVQSVTTNNGGIYVFASVKPGQYQVRVKKPGFKQVDLLGMIVNVQDHIEQNFRLQLGSVSESVTVEGGTSMINTTDASISTVVDQTFVKNMPLNGRSFQDLILLTPGAVTQTPQASPLGLSTSVGRRGEFSVNGQRTESNYYTVDGVSGNVGVASGLGLTDLGGNGASGSVAASTAFGTTQALVSVDALQEFRVQSSTYSAEYGRNPGGQFAFETKSGTNEWHGTAYDYLRNGAVDSQDWFNNYFGKHPAALRQNDFGGTLGGPVRIPGLYSGKDKTFFFVSYEGLRLIAPQAATARFVPDLCMRGVVAQCPSGRQPAASALQPVINAYPMPSPNGLEDAKNGFGQFIGTWSNPSSLNSTSVRFDHVVNDKLRLFFRFSNTESSSAIRGVGSITPTVDNFSTYTMRTYTAGASSLFTNRLSNEFRLNYSSNEATYRAVIEALGGSTPVDLVQLVGLSPGARPEVLLVYSGRQANLLQSHESGAQGQWNWVDTLSLSLGRHRLKFGVDDRRLAPFAIPLNPDVRYRFTSESKVERNTSTTLAIANAPAYPLYMNFSAFAQDEWRVSHRLSLSMGLRWEVNPAPGVTQGLKPYTFQGSSPDTFTLAPQGTPLWQTTWYNFAPRLGVAYILHNASGHETVVRGGGGVFYDTGQQLGSDGFNGPGFSANTSSPSSFPALPTGGIPAIVNPPVPPFGCCPVGFAPHLQLPYTLQWNASIEQAIGTSQALTVSYVGSHASRLLQQNAFSTSNLNAGFLFFIDNSQTADYNSLQIQFRRRLSRGLTALASYTWAHCLDYGSANYYSFERGNCDFDVRHNLSAAFSYDVPNMGHNGFVNAVLHHWGLDDRFTARTAFPVTLLGSFPFAPNGQQLFAAPSFVPGQPIYLYGANCTTVLQGLGDLAPGKGCPGGRAINPNAFVSVASGPGDTPRNFVRGFGAWQMDLAIRRDFPIRERLKLQFRAEAFNIFNHPTFGVINPNVGSQTFGQATGTLANSLSVLTPLYQMGGPRSMQFALKLLF